MNRRIRYQAATCIAALSFTSIASAQFSENFDSYVDGSAIEGQAGWQNWDVCATGNQVFNTASTAQASSGANSLRMVGSGGGCNFCSDTTHELNGPYTSGQWTMSMQTYIPSTFGGDAFVIVMNTYNNCGGPYDWSAQVNFSDNGTVGPDDLQSNVLIDGDQTIIFDQWIELKMEIDLDANSVIYSYNDVQMFSADWTTAGTVEIAALDLFPGDDTTSEWFVDDIVLSAGISSGPIGMNYCSANPNSTGSIGVMGASGSGIVANNDLTLTADSLPPLAFGFFITGPASGFVMNPGGSEGNLCLAGGIGRYVGPGQIQNSGTAGSIQLLIDNTMIPTPNGLVPVTVGETRFFQLWFRDTVMGNPVSNFTDGYEITFL